MSKKVFPHVSTRNNVPKKKSFMAVYLQELVLNIKNLYFFPFVLILYIHKKRKKKKTKYGLNPEEDWGTVKDLHLSFKIFSKIFLSLGEITCSLRK